MNEKQILELRTRYKNNLGILGIVFLIFTALWLFFIMSDSMPSEAIFAIILFGSIFTGLLFLLRLALAFVFELKLKNRQWMMALISFFGLLVITSIAIILILNKIIVIDTSNSLCKLALIFWAIYSAGLMFILYYFL